MMGKQIDADAVAPAVHEAAKPFYKMREIWERADTFGKQHSVGDETPLRHAMPGKEPTAGDMRKLLDVLDQLFGKPPIEKPKS